MIDLTNDFIPKPPPPKQKFSPSSFQQAIFDFIEEPKAGSCIVEAVAGSGKSTTIVEALDKIPAHFRTIFLAFNKSIAQELKNRVPSMVDVKTLNGIGHQAWCGYQKNITIDASKTRNILWSKEIQSKYGKEILKQVSANVYKLVGIAKNHGLVPKEFTDLDGLTPDTPETWDRLIEHFDVQFESDWEKNNAIEVARFVLCAGILDKSTIDFDDQLYMSVIFRANVPKYDFVFVDEAQDVSDIQRALLAMALRPGGRLIAVGDPHQCHPEGAMIEVTGQNRLPIEKIKKGMSLVTYHDHFRGIKTQGRKVLATNKKQYFGQILLIKAGKEVVKVTQNHRLPTRLCKGAYKKYAVYLMEYNQTSRLGCCKLMYTHGFGPTARMRYERASRIWVLKTFDNIDDAKIFETAMTLKFGLPEQIFYEKGHLKQRLMKAFGNNSDRADKCLFHNNRLYKYPLASRHDKKHIGKYLYITESCNLMNEVNEVRTFDGTRFGGDWTLIKIKTIVKKCIVYSLSVESTEGGHKFYVADNILVHNSIYGFRGADSQALNNIAKTFNATRLPLSISYRCAKAIVKEAQRFVNHITASESSPEGLVEDIGEYTKKLSMFKRGDMVVCRCTAPLIKLAYTLIAAKKPVLIAGRDIGKQIAALILSFEKHTVDEIRIAIINWHAKKKKKMLAKDPEHDLSKIDDTLEAIETFIECSGALSIDQLIRSIESLFNGSIKDSTLLSTIHRSKGLEADRVFILDAHLMPIRYAKKLWQKEQETNLQYVAVTRAKSELYYVNSPEGDDVS